MPKRTNAKVAKGDSVMRDIIAGDLVVKDLQEDPICSICQEPFLKNEPTKVVHKTRACEHKFHAQCIDAWCQECFKNRKHPTCPLCPNYKIPLSICPKPEIIEEEEEEEEVFVSQFHETAVRRLRNIPYNMSYNERFRIPIFM